ncbi:MAG: hypothetical protein ACD_46C00041G0003 [uncultured bacterium]|nr:MAG: hypothetical protein ACD_46C00041G0003 [uncultured bacterium]
MKEKSNTADINFYEIWMNLSKQFYQSANENLQHIFSQEKKFEPENHIEMIQQWLNSIRDQWLNHSFGNNENQYQKHWQFMIKIYNESADLFLRQWIKQTQDQKPITNIQDLYELWLSSCNEIYRKSLHTAAYQEIYGEMMNAALKFWNIAPSK